MTCVGFSHKVAETRPMYRAFVVQGRLTKSGAPSSSFDNCPINPAIRQPSTIPLPRRKTPYPINVSSTICVIPYLSRRLWALCNRLQDQEGSERKKKVRRCGSNGVSSNSLGANNFDGFNGAAEPLACALNTVSEFWAGDCGRISQHTHWTMCRNTVRLHARSPGRTDP